MKFFFLNVDNQIYKLKLKYDNSFEELKPLTWAGNGSFKREKKKELLTTGASNWPEKNWTKKSKVEEK